MGLFIKFHYLVQTLSRRTDTNGSRFPKNKTSSNDTTVPIDKLRVTLRLRSLLLLKSSFKLHSNVSLSPLPLEISIQANHRLWVNTMLVFNSFADIANSAPKKFTIYYFAKSSTCFRIYFKITLKNNIPCIKKGYSNDEIGS